MSQDLDKTSEESLSDDQLNDVSGGLSDRFDDARQRSLNQVTPDKDELSEEQLKGVTGGLSERFKDAQQENLDAHLSDRFEAARQESINSH